MQLVREGTLGEAIAAFDAAILADPSAADSYYQRARALVLLGRADEALQDALRAAAVDPGVPMLHELVAQLALNPTEAQLALEHGVVAAHGGIDMRAHFDSLAPLLADPAEIQERLRAPRFVVRALSSDNPNPVIDAALRAKGLVALRRALVASSHLGVVIDPALATHALLVEATELSEGPPRQLTIRIEMVDPAGERLYQQNVILHNIDDPDATSADLATFLVVVGARLRAAVASVGFNRR